MGRVLLVAAGLICAALGSAAARAQGTIGDIKVSGNQRIAADTIVAQLQFARGAAYDPAAVDQSLKALFATGQFSDVRIRMQGTTVEVIVVENPTIARIEVKGNAAIETSKLEAELQLKKGAIYTRAKAEADARRIRDVYRQQGRFETTIEPSTTPLANNQVALQYQVREADVVKVLRIAFTGNKAFSESALRDVITTSQSSWLDVLKTTIFYDRERLALDRELLRRHYNKNGFPNAKIGEASAELDPATKGFVVTFAIEEGERFTFGEMKVESQLDHIAAAEFVPLLLTAKGQVYDATLVDKTVEKVTLELARQGERGATVTPRLQPGTGTNTMAVTYVIAEGPRLTIERIDISGNQRTKDYVIRRELRIADGEPFNRFLVERARKRVEALGFFKTVEIKRAPGTKPNTVALEVAVTEQETGELSFGIGFSENEGIIGDVAYTERNLFGNGQHLKVKLAGSTQRFQADIGFTEPHIFGTDIAAGFDLFYKDLDNTRQSSFKSERAGGSVRTGFAISDSLTAGINYTLSRNKLYDVGANASEAIKEAAGGKESGTYYASSIGYSNTFDGRDRPRNPTSGVYYSLSQDFAGIGGDVRYIRNNAEIRGYYPVTDKVTLAARASGGTIGGWGGEDVRLLDLFYKGSETVRGFAPGGFGPRDGLSTNKDALGGKQYFATTAELRFPVPLVPEDIGLRAAVFADAGSLWGVTERAKALQGLVGNTPALRASVGAGLIWDSPIGPLRLDYAVPVLKQSFDKTQALSFGMVPVF